MPCVVGFYIEDTSNENIEMVLNYALLNQQILRNKSIILFHVDMLKARPNLKDCFKGMKHIPIINFMDTDYYIQKHGIETLYQLAEIGKTERLSKRTKNCVHLLSDRIQESRSDRIVSRFEGTPYPFLRPIYGDIGSESIKKEDIETMHCFEKLCL